VSNGQSINKTLTIKVSKIWVPNNNAQKNTLCLLSWLEWTNSHQCINLGWGCSNHFGDEPKTHPLPLPEVFLALFFAPNFSPLTFLLLTSPLLPISPHIGLIPSSESRKTWKPQSFKGFGVYELNAIRFKQSKTWELEGATQGKTWKLESKLFPFIFFVVVLLRKRRRK
jgi:hypothetical protein